MRVHEAGADDEAGGVDDARGFFEKAIALQPAYMLYDEPTTGLDPVTSAVIDEAMFNAFDDDREVTEKDLVEAAGMTNPLAVTAKEKIDSLREWATARARFATTKTADAMPQMTRRMAK